MENYAIYTHFAGLEKLIELIKPAFPKAEPLPTQQDGFTTFTVTRKSGLFGKKESLTINYREKESPSYHLRDGNDAMTKQMRGMYGFISSLPIKDLELRERFLKKIETINAEIIFLPDPALTADLKELLKTIATSLHAFVFTQADQNLNKSSNQAFLDEDLSIIVDVEGNTGNTRLDVKIDQRFFDDQAAPTPAQQTRKERTEALLAQHQVKINKHLPPTPEASHTQLRDKTEVLERALCLALLAATGEGVPQDRIDQEIGRLALTGFTPKEQELLTKENRDDQDRANMTWRYESLNVLFWALSLTDSLVFPTTICDVGSLVSIVIQNSRAELEQKAQLRSTEEILGQLDQTYRMHWACVDARLNGRAPDGQLSASVIYERHYALNWLVRYLDQDWDDVSTDT